MEALQRATESNNFEFLLILGMLLMLGLVYQSDRERIQLFVRGFFNASLISQQARQERSFTRVAFPTLLVTLIVLALFTAYAFDYFDPENQSSIAEVFLLLVAALLGISILRWLIYTLFAFLFEVQEAMPLFQFEWVLTNFILALFLIPLIVLYAFGPQSMHDTVIYTGIGALAAFYMIRAIRQFRVATIEVQIPIVYNVLYFCALEILPPMVAVAGVLR